jgi:hypothetical protein
MRFIWFSLEGSDPESGTENHILNIGRNYPRVSGDDKRTGTKHTDASYPNHVSRVYVLHEIVFFSEEE